MVLSFPLQKLIISSGVVRLPRSPHNIRVVQVPSVLQVDNVKENCPQHICCRRSDRLSESVSWLEILQLVSDNIQGLLTYNVSTHVEVRASSDLLTGLFTWNILISIFLIYNNEGKVSFKMELSIYCWKTSFTYFYIHFPFTCSGKKPRTKYGKFLIFLGLKWKMNICSWVVCTLKC